MATGTDTTIVRDGRPARWLLSVHCGPCVALVDDSVPDRAEPSGWPWITPGILEAWYWTGGSNVSRQRSGAAALLARLR